MEKQISAGTIAVVKGSAPALRSLGVAITTRMYVRLFVDPEMARLFDTRSRGASEQPRKLAAAILAVAENVERLDALGPVLDRIAATHVGAGIRADHYAKVADCLLGAMADVLGDAATGDMLTAWGEAYWFLAHDLIAREAGLARTRAAA